jgi:hypothetical protein
VLLLTGMFAAAFVTSRLRIRAAERRIAQQG